KKRSGQDDVEPQKKAKSMKVVAEVERPPNGSLRHPPSSSASSGARQPSLAMEEPERFPSAPPSQSARTAQSETARGTELATPQSGRTPTLRNVRPLFHAASPSVAASQPRAEHFHQLSQADQQIIRASGLGLEKMTPAEIVAMLDDDDLDLD